MFKHRFASALALLFALFASTAQAFWDSPYITPANPVAGDIISMNIRMGVCDAMIAWPGFPQVTRSGNAITFINHGQHWDSGDLCSYGTGTGVFPIGVYEPGNYTLTVDLAYRDFFSQPHILTLGVVIFTITGVGETAIPVPTMSILGSLALLLLLSATAIFRLLQPRCLALLNGKLS